MPQNTYGFSLHPPHPGLVKILPNAPANPRPALPAPVAPTPGTHASFKAGLPPFPSVYNIFQSPPGK